MLAEIVLPAGTEKVVIRSIPERFADALYPKLPKDTPSQITKLKKYPLTEENSRHWCGEGSQPFPISLTSDDVAELNRSVWIGLPPLKLPINEPEWQPYRVALEKKPPKDWMLKVDLLNRVLDARISWDRTTEVYLAEVEKAAGLGHLAPRCMATLRPSPAASGELLLDCFVTLENFVSYAARFEIGVRVAEVVSEPQAKPVEVKGASESVKADTNWRIQIQAEAYERWLRLRASGCNPSVHSICEDMAKWCIEKDIKGGKGQNPRAGTIRNTVLGAGHWMPPPHSVEKAKKHIEQIARTAQTQVAQIKR